MTLLTLLLACGLAEQTPAEQALAACDEGNAEACTALGIMRAEGDGVARKRTHALELFERGCTGGDAVGCYRLGSREIARADGSGKSTGYQLACELKLDDGCMRWGERLFESKQYSQAVAVLRPVCDAGNDRFCVAIVGLLHDTNQAEQVQQAIEIGTDGCVAGQTAFCNNAAWYWATHPRVDRAGVDGVALARLAVKANPGDTGVLDTLAAALARAGEFEEAVQIQERLVAAATDPEHLPSYRLRLEGYKEGYPWAEYARGGGYVDRD